MQLPSPPQLVNIRQRFPATRIENVPAAVREQLETCGVRVREGARIAIAVGSRGITDLLAIVRETIRWVRSQQAEPFIVPAMGSHGGATAEGQQAVLAGYGIAEEAVGAPVVSSLRVIELPREGFEIPLYFDAAASSADGTILINRIKPHTSFHGTYESGLMKMTAVGLGKHAQALAIHALGVRGLREVMPAAATRILRYGNVVLGIAVIENAYDETMAIRAIPAREIAREEPPLLELARRNMPGLPSTALDVLIVDEMGKNISGLGMDTNIIGRLKIPGQPEPDSPRITAIYVRDLTAESHGNAVGVGLADIISRRLFEKIDFHATYENALTSTFLERAKIPIIADNDRQAIGMALRAASQDQADAARIIRIKNTLRLDRLQVSPAVLADLKQREGIEVLSPVEELFDEGDWLTPLPAD